jgi:hypothetical protein
VQQHRLVVERTERQEVGQFFERGIDQVDHKCQPEQRKDLLVVGVIMFAPTGDEESSWLVGNSRLSGVVLVARG